MVVLSSYPLLACRERRNIPCFFCNSDSKVLISGKSKEAAFVIVTQTTAKFDFSICLISYFFFLFFILFSLLSLSFFSVWCFSHLRLPLFMSIEINHLLLLFFMRYCVVSGRFLFYLCPSSISAISDALSSSCILCRMDCRQKCDELKRTESFTIEVRRRLRFSQSVEITDCHYCKVNMQRGVLGAHVL